VEIGGILKLTSERREGEPIILSDEVFEKG